MDDDIVDFEPLVTVERPSPVDIIHFHPVIHDLQFSLSDRIEDAIARRFPGYHYQQRQPYNNQKFRILDSDFAHQNITSPPVSKVNVIIVETGERISVNGSRNGVTLVDILEAMSDVGQQQGSWARLAFLEMVEGVEARCFVLSD